jgi:phosphate:Na+ symporter
MLNFLAVDGVWATVTIDSANRTLLILIADPDRKDAGALINFITYSQRLKDKLTNFANISMAQNQIDNKLSN